MIQMATVTTSLGKKKEGNLAKARTETIWL